MNPTYIFTPQELTNLLLKSMADLEFDGGDKEWTRKLKLSLWERLQSRDTNATDVLFSHAETDNHEFLLDLVVWDRSEGEGLTLALESEWIQTKEEIERDFWKLLTVKCYTKVMVFALNKKPRKHTPEAIWTMLSDCLRKYRHHLKGERYIFIDFAPGPNRCAWWVEILEEGELKGMPTRHDIQIG